MVALAYRGGVKRFQAHAIYEKDEFEYFLGLSPVLKHKPYLDGDRGKAIAYYAVVVVELPSGEMVFEIMSRAEIEGHSKKYSRSYNNGPWQTEFDEMTKKTVAKKLFKWIPKSTEIAIAVIKDGSVAHIDGEIKSHEDVLEADVRYSEPDNAEPENTKSLESEILASAPKPQQPAQQNKAETLNIPFSEETPKLSNYLSELEKLQAELKTALTSYYTPDEVDMWCLKHFDKPLNLLPKDMLREAIKKINAELESKKAIKNKKFIL